ncbi:hypothetical protein KQX54_009392 [Cotesia glomerata]|uniref:SWIM-type domain-containing protein n=1 Tax=Cotesia glomerata TaxID=32391 RepID=A0AAV7IHA9_COTGL|nr:hypothetical protein KQX54_009392 [Cotesia glomerata]
MNISLSEKDKILKILHRLTYSSSPSEYDKIYTELSNTAPKSVMSYFNQNWHNIKDQWTVHSMVKDTMGIETNNYLESLNEKLKLIMERRESLMDFLKSYFFWKNNYVTETCRKISKNFLKRDVRDMQDNYQKEYQKYLTEGAFKLLKPEIDSSNWITFESIDDEKKEGRVKYKTSSLNVSIDDCQCKEYNSLHLPCRHIFALHKVHDLENDRDNAESLEDYLNRSIDLNKTNLENISLSTKSKVRGRPKNVDKTVIGQFKAKKKFFMDKSKFQKIELMIKWLKIDKPGMVKNALNNEYLLTSDDFVLETQKVKSSFVDERVDYQLLAPYFELKAFKKLENFIIDMRNNNKWLCPECKTKKKDKMVSIL